MEMELVTNAGWILTKNGILQKVKYMLEQLQLKQQELLHKNAGIFPSEVLSISPKISKGENYKGLPYLVLDCPRYFEKDNHFAIRTMFWWGNFFSITLHLSGQYKNKYQDNLQQHFPLLREEGFFICNGPDQWEHHFEKSNYLSLLETDAYAFKECTMNKEFIKLARKYPLAEWENVEERIMASFTSLVVCLSS